jgi:hypothetical protein
MVAVDARRQEEIEGRRLPGLVDPRKPLRDPPAEQEE